MGKLRPRTMMAFGCPHFPYQNKTAIEVFCKAAEHIKPDIVVSLGDMLSCDQFSTHSPTYGMPETSYADDVSQANAFLDRIQRHSDRLVMVEGNHEYRVARWAAVSARGKGTHTMLSPQKVLTAGRKCVYIPYGPSEGTYPHYKVNPRIVAVHGWSYAKNATKAHLAISQGRSVIHAHTHRVDSSTVQNIWSPGKIVEAHSSGCLCKLIPIYGTGTPVEWANAFILGYLGRHSDSLYTVKILKNFCILPDGTEIRA